MKFTITLHPVSLAVGAAALGGVLWLVSAVQAPASTGAATSRAVSQVPLTISNPIEVKGVPVPGNMVTIKEGTPYVVPTGRVLVLTALGAVSSTLVCSSGCSNATEVALLLDGQVEVTTPNATGLVASNGSLAAMAAFSFGEGTSMHALPVGCAAKGGVTVTVAAGGGNIARAWGYLAVP